MPTNLVEFRGFKVLLDDEGIVRGRYRCVDVGLDDAREIIQAVVSLAGGQRRPALVNLAGIKSMSRDARLYFANEETARVHSAIALLVESPLNRAIGNFFMGFNKPQTPTRLFTSEAAALKWLREFLP
jgi:hypothetical protein